MLPADDPLSLLVARAFVLWQDLLFEERISEASLDYVWDVTPEP